MSIDSQMLSVIALSADGREEWLIMAEKISMVGPDRPAKEVISRLRYPVELDDPEEKVCSICMASGQILWVFHDAQDIRQALVRAGCQVFLPDGE